MMMNQVALSIDASAELPITSVLAIFVPFTTPPKTCLTNIVKLLLIPTSLKERCNGVYNWKQYQ